jgi:diaminohydroxyphosphoribosylaminopyrimidine deaminase/5-amino-6-(5-phosphoribosylamino)uracil reductase
VLADLARRGVHALLVEGGSEIAWSFLRAHAVDRIAFFVAPRIVGGRGAVPAVGGPGVRTPEEGFRIGELEIGRIGPDLFVKGRLLPGGPAGRRAVGGPRKRRAPARASGGGRRLRRGSG